MLLAAEVVPISFHVTTVGDREHWQIHYLGQHISTDFFCILGFNGFDTYPIAIIKVTNQEFVFIFIQGIRTNTDQSDSSSSENSQFQNRYNNLPFSKKSINYFNGLLSNKIEEFKMKKNHSQSQENSCEIEELIQEIKAQIKVMQSRDLNNPMNWQEKVQYHRNTVTRYYKLLTKPDLAESESDLDHIEEILQQAEEDDVLSLLLNEVDNLIVQEAAFDIELYTQYIIRPKWLEVFKIHVDSCKELDAEVSRLMTTISSLLEELQNIAEKTTSPPQALEEKVESLELLRQEAKIEKNRRKLKICLNKQQTTHR
jgi:hypothetical protein